MAEIAFCESCGAKHEIESDEHCMCGGDLTRVSEMTPETEEQYRHDWNNSLGQNE